MWYNLLKLGYRNVYRFKRRTIITFCTVSLGLMLLIITMSLLNGIDKQARGNLINCQTSHLTIFKKGYYEKKDECPLDIIIKDPAGICSQLKEIPGVKEVETRVTFIGGLIKGMDELPIRGVGIEPEEDPLLFNIKQSLVEGHWLEPGEAKVLVGKNLAKDIRLAVGKTITLRMIISSEEDLVWNALDLEVKGIFDTGNPTVDSQWVLLPLDLAQRGLSLENQVTEIVVRLNSDSDRTVSNMQAQIKDRVAAQQPLLEVFSWQDLGGAFLVISELKTNRSAMIVFIMLFIAAMGIINTMMMAVFERTREIGMLSAMGMNKSEIKRLFIFEGGFIGAFGSFLGCILGGLAGWYLEVNGLSIASMGDSLKKFAAALYPVKDVFYADLSADLLIMAFVLGTVVSILASLYPASKAAKLKPVEALNYI